MKIGISALSLSRRTAIGFYTERLLNALTKIDSEDEYFIYVRGEAEAERVPKDDRFTVLRSLAPFLNRVILEQFDMPDQLNRFGLEVFFNPDYILPARIKARLKAITVHDMIVMSYPASLSLRARLLYSTFLPTSIGRSDLIIAVSEFTKNEIERYSPDSAGKIAVLNSPVDDMFGEEIAGNAATGPLLIDGDPSYLLYVGSGEPRKNIHYIIKSFLWLRDEGLFSGRLVLCGPRLSFTDPNIILLNSLPVPELRALYRGALFTILVSKIEGFGYPAIESLLCGTPVVVTDKSPMMELRQSVSPSYSGRPFILPVNIQDEDGLSNVLRENLPHAREVKSAVVNEFDGSRYLAENTAMRFLQILKETAARS